MLDTIVARFHGLTADVRAKRERGEGGFTLIELLVVVVIIGILIAIAIPLYLNYQKGAKDKSTQSDLRAAVSTVNQCYTDNGNTYPAIPTGNGTKNANLVFTCGTGTPAPTATANVSDGTTMTYATVSGGFTLSATNSDGNGKTYNYDSTTGGKVNGS